VIMSINFKTVPLTARLVGLGGDAIERRIDVRTNPVTGRKARIAYGRQLEKEASLQELPPRPPTADDVESCPFCPGRLSSDTPQFIDDITSDGRLTRGRSVLFPNLFPYGAYSAVSLFDEHHFVEIGKAAVESYADSFINCGEYLKRVLHYDNNAVFTGITQNHLPSAGGSLVHPHLQVHADSIGGNHHNLLYSRAEDFHKKYGSYLFSEYLGAEQKNEERLIGLTGSWNWLAAFAPEGFFEIWAILPGIFSFFELTDQDWYDLASGVIRVQHFYRSLCRNGYNLGLISIENGQNVMELRLVILARSNYAPWVRSDFTGYETMLGDMATFSPPEQTAELARKFWRHDKTSCG